MFSSIWSDIKRQFNYGNTLTRIILVNIAVFVCAVLLRLVMMPIGDGGGFQRFMRYFEVGADWQHNLFFPWVFITHMFLHTDFWHILWNMLMLHWFGRIVGDLLGDRRILPIYLLGGLAGGLSYFIMANVPTPWDFGSHALGASAALMAILVVAGKTAPDYNISLILIGDVKLKFIVAVLFLLDLIALSNNNNSGGSFGHLGGGLMGYVIAAQLQRGNDLTAPVNRLIERLSSFFSNLFSKRRPSPRVAYRHVDVKRSQSSPSAAAPRRSASREDRIPQEKLDAILDKIKQTGYESLSADEKEFLFNASKQ